MIHTAKLHAPVISLIKEEFAQIVMRNARHALEKLTLSVNRASMDSNFKMECVSPLVPVIRQLLVLAQ